MIRLIEHDELPALADLGAAFFRGLNLPGQFERQVFVNYWYKLISTGAGFIIGRFMENDPVEAIGAVVYPDMQTGELSSCTTFWYVTTNNGGLAVGFLEAALRRHWESIGVKQKFISILCNERLDKVSGFLLRSGYRLAEMQFRKVN